MPELFRALPLHDGGRPAIATEQECMTMGAKPKPRHNTTLKLSLLCNILVPAVQDLHCYDGYHLAIVCLGHTGAHHVSWAVGARHTGMAWALMTASPCAALGCHSYTTSVIAHVPVWHEGGAHGAPLLVMPANLPSTMV
jgi:hypothetical protein